MTVTTTRTDTLTLPLDTFRDALIGTLVSVGKDTTNPVLCTVRIEWDADTVTFIATDRYRMSVGRINQVNAGSHALQINRLDAAVLLKSLPKPVRGDESLYTVFITVQPGDRVTVAVEEIDTTVLSRTFSTVYGTYPDWNKFIALKAVPSEQHAWNPQYMADAAKIPHDKDTPIRWLFSGDYKPMLGRYTEHNNITWTYLLMPVRVTD